MKDSIEVAEAIRRLSAFWDSLAEDVHHAQREATRIATEEKRLDQYWLRSSFRSFFALVEAMAFAWKREALSAHARGALELSTGEMALLRDESYELTANGKVVARTKFIPTKQNVRFAFGILSKTFNTVRVADFGISGWEIFQRSLLVRNRISHPKRIEEGLVSMLDISP